ncbi:methyltransferase domain-containing protein [Brevundimonas sp. S30B]|uniref:methyltransferase domain-containing protein n=1 Tax=Brevundimonas sp. MF30-B TaxID=2561924 RepID=UPI001072607E|nr:methyltransferase domain-containing protein [Brevundimonas sp. MF30-B]TFW01739.1 methyltransferase domain-containing protein [Brevundimonas sp. S30B]
MTDPRWDPGQYSRFEVERDRAVLDLMLRLPPDLSPREIWDLGCGTGQHAAILRRRHPEASVHGLDSSIDMLEQARAADPLIDWRQGDIADWTPETPPDLILANASLQWLPDHQTLLSRLAGSLAPGGVLAVQMPMAFETRHHSILRAVAAEGPWASTTAPVRPLQPLLTMQQTYDLLSSVCDEIDLWSTTYLHVLTGEDAVLEWMKGTALRPYLTILEATAWTEAFLSTLASRLSDAFEQRADGTTLLPFPRLFLIARRRRS